MKTASRINISSRCPPRDPPASRPRRWPRTLALAVLGGAAGLAVGAALAVCAPVVGANGPAGTPTPAADGLSAVPPVAAGRGPTAVARVLAPAPGVAPAQDDAP